VEAWTTREVDSDVPTRSSACTAGSEIAMRAPAAGVAQVVTSSGVSEVTAKLKKITKKTRTM